jgi:Phasin protein
MARGQKIGIDERVESTMEAASRLPLFDGSVARMMSWPVEAWLRAQAEILKASEPVATGWLERRRAAATATLDTIERLAHCNDLKEAAAIQRGWFEESMKRLDSDFNAFADQALAVSHETISATRYAAQTSADVVALAIQPVQRAAEQRPVDAAA